MKPVRRVQPNEPLHVRGDVLRRPMELLLRRIARELARTMDVNFVAEVSAPVSKDGDDGGPGRAREPKRAARHARRRLEEPYRNRAHRRRCAVDLDAEHAPASKVGEEREHGERLTADVRNAY